jgi:hypothetical protein
MRKEKSPRQDETALLSQHVDIHGRLLHHPYPQTVDLVVYRPAGCDSIDEYQEGQGTRRQAC